MPLTLPAPLDKVEDMRKPRGGGGSYMEQMGMLIGNFEFNP